VSSARPRNRDDATVERESNGGREAWCYVRSRRKQNGGRKVESVKAVLTENSTVDEPKLRSRLLIAFPCKTCRNSQKRLCVLLGSLECCKRRPRVES
jgi:hypothetical protein